MTLNENTRQTWRKNEPNNNNSNKNNNRVHKRGKKSKLLTSQAHSHHMSTIYKFNIYISLRVVTSTNAHIHNHTICGCGSSIVFFCCRCCCWIFPFFWKQMRENGQQICVTCLFANAYQYIHSHIYVCLHRLKIETSSLFLTLDIII